MNIEDTIRVLSNERACVMRNTEEACDRNCAACDLVLPDELVISAYRTAINILRAQQEAEKNEPLTLNDLRQMAERCEGVYIAHTDGTDVFRGRKYCAAVLDTALAFGSMKTHVQAIYGDKLTVWEDDYGKTWVAYRRPPEGGAA